MTSERGEWRDEQVCDSFKRKSCCATSAQILFRNATCCAVARARFNRANKGDQVTVRVHARNMQISEQTRSLAEDRVKHATRIFDDGGSVDVEFTERPNPRQAEGRFKVEITSTAAGHIVRIEAEASELKAALDSAADRFERQLRRLKERLIQRNRRRDKGLNPPVQASDVEQDRGAVIVRTKRFEMKPMTAEEAALQMEMLGHEFFFFLDGESGQHCVVYRRRDGDVGLIEPE